jgi:hypothetical protein
MWRHLWLYTFTWCVIIIIIIIIIIIPCSRVLLEKLTATQLVKKFPPYIESEGSLPCSQEPATGPWARRMHSTPSYPISLRSQGNKVPISTQSSRSAELRSSVSPAPPFLTQTLTARHHILFLFLSWVSIGTFGILHFTFVTVHLALSNYFTASRWVAIYTMTKHVLYYRHLHALLHCLCTVWSFHDDWTQRSLLGRWAVRMERHNGNSLHSDTVDKTLLHYFCLLQTWYQHLQWEHCTTIQTTFSFKETGDSRKFKCVELKSDLDIFVSPAIFKGKEIKNLCTDIILK